MNQFKREFMGLGDPSFKRATTCQKCLRTGDIENVGKTAFHETFFEMLGNFSFGDYFKREAIHWAWEFLTGTLKIPADRLTITVYLDDDEAYNIWHDEIKVPADRITRMGEDDNFWPAGAPTHGPNGVCGPCSEIFYHGDGPKEVEIWNLVFTQFNRIGPGQLEPLPKKNIDTGMGLERTAACLQGVSTVFETDIFKPIVAAVAETLGVPYDRDQPDGVRIRRMADHSRALTFCIHENVRPGPEKQGYVIRRLLRRAVLDAYQMGRREPFLYQIVPVVAEVMSRPYPELQESVRRIQTTDQAGGGAVPPQPGERPEAAQRRLPEDQGRRAPTRSRARTPSTSTRPTASRSRSTESLAADQNLRIDRAGFESRAREARGRSRAGRPRPPPSSPTGPLDTLKKEYHHGSEFVGYATTAGRRRGSSASSSRTGWPSRPRPTAGHSLVLVLDRTPFYGESGGQVGDTGDDPRRAVHVPGARTPRRRTTSSSTSARWPRGRSRSSDKVHAEVDADRREAIRRAHSATHLLHHALQTILGKHAQQAGSKVEPDRLRFDFANPEAVGRDRLRAIEETVNERVLAAAPVELDA